jgi:hypothetical protein
MASIDIKLDVLPEGAPLDKCRGGGLHTINRAFGIGGGITEIHYFHPQHTMRPYFGCALCGKIVRSYSGVYKHGLKFCKKITAKGTASIGSTQQCNENMTTQETSTMDNDEVKMVENIKAEIKKMEGHEAEVNKAEVKKAEGNRVEDIKAEIKKVERNEAVEGNKAEVITAEGNRVEDIKADIKKAEIKKAEIKKAEVTTAEITTAEITTAEITTAEVKTTEGNKAAEDNMAVEGNKAEVKTAERNRVDDVKAEIKKAEVTTPEVKMAEGNEVDGNKATEDNSVKGNEAVEVNTTEDQNAEENKKKPRIKRKKPTTPVARQPSKRDRKPIIKLDI